MTPSVYQHVLPALVALCDVPPSFSCLVPCTVAAQLTSSVICCPRQGCWREYRCARHRNTVSFSAKSIRSGRQETNTGNTWSIGTASVSTMMRRATAPQMLSRVRWFLVEPSAAESADRMAGYSERAASLPARRWSTEGQRSVSDGPTRLDQ